MLILPLYYQVVRGESALSAGLLLAPQGVGAAMAMPIAGRLTDRLGAGRVVPFGVVVACWAPAVYTQLTATRRTRCWASRCGCAGIGLGMTMMPAMAAAYQTLERAAVPRATSTINIIRTIGGSFGHGGVDGRAAAADRCRASRARRGDLGALRGGAAAVAEPLAAAFGHDVLVGGRADGAGADPGVLLATTPAWSYNALRL